MSLQAKCPACGGDIEWKLGDSLVVVCSYCHSAIARADRQLSDLGKVADLADTGSQLRLGLAGSWKNMRFTLVGHGQMAHPQGGTWDEWYVHFSDGRWGWLAEAQGQLYLTFRGHAPALPAYDELVVGEKVFDEFIAAEKSHARALGAEGEMPFEWRRDAEWNFCDLSGPSGVTGTLDYSEAPPIFFVGRTVTLAELGIAASAKINKADPTQIKAVELACPNCGGPLPLRAPNEAMRVTCPSCSGLLDVSHGKLSYLRALERPDVQPALPLGRVGTLLGVRYTVIGFMRRGVTSDRTLYPWSEYLLHDPKSGFRWLVEANGHWSFVEPLLPGELGAMTPIEKTYRKTTFKPFQRGEAEVLHVLGEFYWKVEVGDRVETLDYIAPPLELSAEKTPDEISWSVGTYLSRKDLRGAFGGGQLSSAEGVGANQPFAHSGVIKLWPVMIAAALGIWLVIISTRDSKTLYEQALRLDPAAAPVVATPEPADPSTGAPPVTPDPPADPGDKIASQVVFSDPVQLSANQSIEVSVATNVNNSWLSLDGDLIEESTGEVHTFGVPVEYYSGYEGGESWSEGSHNGSQLVTAQRPGSYTLRFELQWEKSAPPPDVTITLHQGVLDPSLLIWVLIAISILPGLLLWRRNSFETRRWDDADFDRSGAVRTYSHSNEENE